MDVEKLAELFHEASYEVDKQNKKKCTYNDYTKNGVEIWCENGEVYRDAGGFGRSNDEKCPRCKGTGLEPYTEWNDLDEKTRENYRIQAQFINDKLLLPMFEKVVKACLNLGKCLDDNNSEVIYLGQDVGNVLAEVINDHVTNVELMLINDKIKKK